MIRATTPTYTLTLPEGINLNEAYEVWVAFSQPLQDDQNDEHKVVKVGRPQDQEFNDEIEINGNVVEVLLTQEDTQQFDQGRKVLVQLNWIYENRNSDGSPTRFATEIASIMVRPNLISETQWNYQSE